MVVAAIGESRGQKDDARDAYKLADDVRTGAIKRRVFKDVGQYNRLREPSRTRSMIVRDVVRIQNRLKRLYRSRGIAVSRQSIYSRPAGTRPRGGCPRPCATQPPCCTRSTTR
ncbi:IS110 family transposase [Sorangium sp. So ce302]|uniref:IS110 family transposase n=1 Tax=Sorangium sp. So ce302 TaxID=3133297 RepID=UPI003F60ACCA